ncbi:MAG: extracellular solute-binding protein [Gemmatimonadota bacterium]|nr:MAG: extracellular solute-binding protein [Gemmatimonadota bacterium]
MALTGCAIIIFGCSSKTGEKDGKVELVYWPSSNQQEIDLAEEVVKRWNESHPDVRLIMQPLPESRSGEEVLLAAIAGGTTPDVCSNIWPGVTGQFVEAGALVAVDQFEDFETFMEDRTPRELIESFRSPDGHIYQVPWKGNPIMMQYNTKLFRDAHIGSPPQTYSEFMSAAAKLTTDLDGDGQYDRWVADPNMRAEWRERLFDFYVFYIVASGGHTLLKDGQVDFDNREAVRVFQFWAEGYQKGYFPRVSFTGDAFLQGKVAVHITGPWNIAHTEKNKPEGFEYDIAPLPVPDEYQGSQVTYGDYKNIAIFGTTKYPQQAWEFVKFMLGTDNDLRLLEICDQLPLRKALLSDTTFQDYFRRNPMMEKFAALLPHTVGVDNSPYLQEVFEAISQEYEACCIYGRKDPQQAVRDAAIRSEKILRRK